MLLVKRPKDRIKDRAAIAMVLKNCNERMAPHRIAQVKRIPWCKRLCNVHATLAKNFTVIESLAYQKTFSGISASAIFFRNLQFSAKVQPIIFFEKLGLWRLEREGRGQGTVALNFDETVMSN